MRAVAASGSTSAGGSYALSANGSFIYTPAVGFKGDDSFSYVTTDGMALSNSATVTLTLSVPSAPAVGLLDDFVRPNATSLGANWTQSAGTTAPPDLQIATNQARAVSTQQGGLAIWNTAFGNSQAAAFASAAPLVDSALVLKATGGTLASPANYVRVRCELGNGGEVVVATMMGGSNVAVFARQAAFPASGCVGSGGLAATVDAKGLVSVFLNGFIGGVQLPDVAAWKGEGRIGLQLQTRDAMVTDFSGGTL
jgi:hypothetical protein